MSLNYLTPDLMTLSMVHVYGSEPLALPANFNKLPQPLREEIAKFQREDFAGTARLSCVHRLT